MSTTYIYNTKEQRLESEDLKCSGEIATDFNSLTEELSFSRIIENAMKWKSF